MSLVTIRLHIDVKHEKEKRKRKKKAKKSREKNENIAASGARCYQGFMVSNLVRKYPIAHTKICKRTRDRRVRLGPSTLYPEPIIACLKTSAPKARILDQCFSLPVPGRGGSYGEFPT